MRPTKQRNLPVLLTHPQHYYSVLVAYSIGRMATRPANCRPHSSLPELTYGHPKLAFRAKWDSGSLATSYLLPTVRMRSLPQQTNHCFQNNSFYLIGWFLTSSAIVRQTTLRIAFSTSPSYPCPRRDLQTFSIGSTLVKERHKLTSVDGNPTLAASNKRHCINSEPFQKKLRVSSQRKPTFPSPSSTK